MYFLSDKEEEICQDPEEDPAEADLAEEDRAEVASAAVDRVEAASAADPITDRREDLVTIGASTDRGTITDRDITVEADALAALRD